MKLDLKETGIYLIPENFADRLYLGRFIKELDKNHSDVSIIEASYSSENSGGYCDPKKLVETEYQVEENGGISMESITELEIRIY